MKKQFVSAVLIATVTFACHHDSVEQAATSSLSYLSDDELKIASGVGRLTNSSEVILQASSYQQSNPNSTFAVSFNRSTIETILAQMHTIGLRAYYVIGSKGQLDLTLVGVDKNLNNQYTANTMFSDGQFINEEKVKQQIGIFQAENSNAIRAVTFGSPLFLTLLSQPNCNGIRFYFITDKNGNRNLMFVGIDSQGKDLIKNVKPNARTSDDGDAGSDGPVCPRHCA